MNATTHTRIMKTPHVDHEALQSQIAAMQKDASTADIRTRSQVRLEQNEKDRERLEEQRRDVDLEIERVEGFRKKIEDLLSVLRANKADIEIDLSAALATIDSLRKSGVTL